MLEEDTRTEPGLVYNPFTLFFLQTLWEVHGPEYVSKVKKWEHGNPLVRS